MVRRHILKKEINISDRKKNQILDFTFNDMLKALDQQDIFEQLIIEMKDYLQDISFEEGQSLLTREKTIKGFYLIESGEVSTFMDQDTGQGIQLSTMGSGSIIGEKDNAATSIIVKKSGIIHHLSDENLRNMEAQHLEMAFKLYKYMSQTLGERLARTNNVT